LPILAGARGVVADLLRHEFGYLDRLSVALVGVVVGVALGDELVAFAEPLVGALCCRPIEDEVAERWVEFGELPGLFTAVVLLPESGVEACFPALGVGQLRVGGDELREGLLRADSHQTDSLPDTQPRAGVAGVRQVHVRIHVRDYSSPVGRRRSASNSRRSSFS